jgi:phosphatidate cytidylyltransferase
MKTKVMTGIAASLLGITVLILQFTPVMGIFVALFSVLSVYEILRTAQVKNKPMFVVCCIVAAAIPPAVEYKIFDRYPLPIYTLLFAYVFILFALMLAQYEKTRFEHTAISFFVSTMIPCSMSSLMLIRDMYKVTDFDPYTKTNCVFLVLFALMCAWITDTAAFFFGRKFGRHKMAPNISPKKSWEGAIGGIVGNTAVSLIVWACFQFAAKKGLVTALFMPAWAVAAASVVLSVAAMLGDLSASAVKRNYGVKDFGTIMGMGNGGAMDRFDSALFAIPATYGIILLYESIR